MAINLLSDYLANDALTYYFTTNSPVTRPTTWFVALHTGDPGAAGTANEVTTGGNDANYVRKAVTFAAVSGRQTSNTGAVTFNAAAAASNYTVTHVSIWSASTSGNCYAKGQLDASKLVTTGDVVAFAIGDLILSTANTL